MPQSLAEAETNQNKTRALEPQTTNLIKGEVNRESKSATGKKTTRQFSHKNVADPSKPKLLTRLDGLRTPTRAGGSATPASPTWSAARRTGGRKRMTQIYDLSDPAIR